LKVLPNRFCFNIFWTNTNKVRKWSQSETGNAGNSKMSSL